MIARPPRSGSALVAAAAALALATWLFLSIGLMNPTTVALAYLLIVLVTATTSPLWTALATSVLAMLSFNFFFLPPYGRLTIADPENWIAFLAFVIVSIVTGNLANAARERAREATAHRDEMRRLFDLSRDILLTDQADALAHLARHVAARFDLGGVALCLPEMGQWRIHYGGPRQLRIDSAALDTALADASAGGLDAGDASRTTVFETGATIVPLRFGLRPVGLLLLAGAPLGRQTLDALGGLAALAVERHGLLAERGAAERERERAALSDALLASFSHDLRTPLTAIEMAAVNLKSGGPDASARSEQAGVIAAEVGRLKRLFQNIIDMARLDADRVEADRRWVDPAEIVEAAVTRADPAVRGRTLNLRVDSRYLVHVDPRLTAAAIGYVLENAAHYSAALTPIDLHARAERDAFVVSVRDRGAGIPNADLTRIFERFFRGADARRQRAGGSGMGLAIAQGLVRAQAGSIEAINHPEGGAQLSIVIPAESRVAAEPAERAEAAG